MNEMLRPFAILSLCLIITEQFQQLMNKQTFLLMIGIVLCRRILNVLGILTECTSLVSSELDEKQSASTNSDTCVKANKARLEATNKI